MARTCFKTRQAFTKTALAVMSSSLAISVPGRSRKSPLLETGPGPGRSSARDTVSSACLRILVRWSLAHASAIFTLSEGVRLEHVAEPIRPGPCCRLACRRALSISVLMRQAEQPGAELAPCPGRYVSNLAEQLHEDVLDDVIRIELVETLLAQEPEEHRPVDGVELAPSFGVLLADPDR